MFKKINDEQQYVYQKKNCNLLFFFFFMYKQKGESIKAKNMGSLREQRFLLLFVLFLTTVTSSTSSSRKLCLELLLIFESRVGLLDNAGFGFNHFLLHPRSGRHHVSEHSRLLLIATTHRPR
jgi:hypothetical protein